MSLPTDIIRPAAGITAITTIRTLPSFWRKSNENTFFFSAFSFGSSSSASSMSLSPAFTLPLENLSETFSGHSVITTGVMVFIFFFLKSPISTFAIKSPVVTLSPIETSEVNPSEPSETVSSPKCTSTSTPSLLLTAYACFVGATEVISPVSGEWISPLSSGTTAIPSPKILSEKTASGTSFIGIISPLTGEHIISFCMCFLLYSFHISLLYSLIVRSEEKYPAFAILVSIFFAQLNLSS